MSKILLLILSVSMLVAKSIDLGDIVSYVRENHPNYKALQENNLALNAKVLAQNAKEMSSLSFDIVDTKLNESDGVFEYSLGFETVLDLTNIRDLETKSATLESEVLLLNRQKELFGFINRVKNLYHVGCLNRQSKQILQTTLDDFNRLYQKKEKAYEFGEISKKELLQLKIQQKLLDQEIKSYSMKYQISKESLLKLISIPNKESLEFECRDLYPIVKKIEIKDEAFVLSKLAYKKRLKSLDQKMQRYQKKFEKIGMSINYDSEIDSKKASVGFNLPLTFTSSKNEKNRVYILKEKKMLEFQYNGWLLEQNAKKSGLEVELRSDFEKIEVLKESIKIYKDTLMPLIEKSFKMGESSVIEYLIQRQRFLEISLDLIKTKKSYYSKLFELYTLIEMEK